MVDHTSTARQVIRRPDAERGVIAALAAKLTTTDEVMDQLQVPWRDAFVEAECIAAFEAATTGARLFAAEGVAPPADLVATISTLRDAALRRQAFVAVQEIGAEIASPRSAEHLVDRFTDAAFALRETTNPVDRLVASDALLDDAMGEIQRRIDHRARTGNSIYGVPSGLSQLDLMTTGFGLGTTTVVMAAPGIGKTNLVNQVAYYAATQDTWVLYVSLENSARDLITKNLIRLGNGSPGTSADEVRHGTADVAAFDGLRRRYARETGGRLFIVGAGSASGIDVIRQHAERLRRMFPDQQGMIVVDYLQQLATSSDQEEIRLAVADISSKLRHMAVQLNLAVVAISSISRENYKTDTPPTLGSGKESGSIEYDCDLLLGLWRDKEKSVDDDQAAIGCRLLKNRTGPLGDITLTVDWRRLRFAEHDDVSRFSSANYARAAAR